MEVRDFGIAITDAKRLNECWRELAEDFASKPSIEGDEALWLALVHVSPGDTEWVHRTNGRNIAEIEIRRAVVDGRLPLWLRMAEGEMQVDIQAVREVSHAMIAAGTYLTENLPKSNLNGRPLWVKNEDWARFRHLTLLNRYGAAEANAMATPLTSEIAESHKLRRAGGPGRTSKYDWESAMASVVARANTPDGLPEGHGAQAGIERLLADFFGDDCPSESQIRLRAAKIMGELDRARR